MPHIAVRSDLPGIAGLMAAKPASGTKLRELAEQILRGPSPLSQGERELIAAHVSYQNDCYYCMSSHGAAACYALGDDGSLLNAVRQDAETAPLSPRMRALLAIAEKVRVSGHAVAASDIARAREAGAGDDDLHDTVLIAAAFCMYNRYVDGLDAITPRDQELYQDVGAQLVDKGYLATGT
jgi:uncharacterized peroxidase-related enzyme